MLVYFIMSSAIKQIFLIFAVINKKDVLHFFSSQGVNKMMG